MWRSITERFNMRGGPCIMSPCHDPLQKDSLGGGGLAKGSLCEKVHYIRIHYVGDLRIIYVGR